MRPYFNDTSMSSLSSLLAFIGQLLTAAMSLHQLLEHAVNIG
jgi:hypothetical protein